MLPMLLEEQQETLICEYFGKLLTRMENCNFQICRYNELTHALNYCADFYQFISNLQAFKIYNQSLFLLSSMKNIVNIK